MKLAQLRPGGRLIIRDVVGPDDAERQVLLIADTRDGKDCAPSAIPADRPASVLGQLSTASRFRLFAADFLRDIRETGRRRDAPTMEFEETDAGWRVSLRTAAEFISKKDYVDNWRSEMNEEFCFWSFTQWKTVLAEIGFRVLESAPNAGAGSRVYTNPWIIEHRYRGHVRLAGVATPHEEIPFPPTNMVVVAEKPRH